MTTECALMRAALLLVSFPFLASCLRGEDSWANDGGAEQGAGGEGRCPSCEQAEPEVDERTGTLVCPERSIAAYVGEGQIVEEEFGLFSSSGNLYWERIVQFRDGTCLDNVVSSGFFVEELDDGKFYVVVNLPGVEYLMLSHNADGTAGTLDYFGFMRSDDIRVVSDDVHDQWLVSIRSRFNPQRSTERQIFDPEVQLCISRKAGCPMEIDGEEENLF